MPIGKAAIRQTGADLTLITWGNCVESATEAAERLANEVSIELIDLRTISPWDRATVCESLEKTGRLVVVQEDVRSCSVGQMLISEVSSDPESWGTFISPPQLVSREDVHVGFNPIYEDGALPDADRVVDAIRVAMEE